MCQHMISQLNTTLPRMETFSATDWYIHCFDEKVAKNSKTIKMKMSYICRVNFSVQWHTCVKKSNVSQTGSIPILSRYSRGVQKGGEKNSILNCTNYYKCIKFKIDFFKFKFLRTFDHSIHDRPFYGKFRLFYLDKFYVSLSFFYFVYAEAIHHSTN